ncbi:MAG: hypothetical protein JW991_04425 [Candidatus Pacebacteria bacterium]|nr:hypothetical protein [Candidatus Paceibacterota bacterium]
MPETGQIGMFGLTTQEKNRFFFQKKVPIEPAGESFHVGFRYNQALAEMPVYCG